MFSKLAKKASRSYAEKAPAGRGMSFWRSLLVLVVSISVTVLIVVSLWVSVSAIVEKVKISRGMSQIIDVVDLSRRVAGAEHSFGSAGPEDILVRLARLQQIQIVGDNSQGLRTLVNPWGGTLVATTLPDNLFRVETVVPSRVCMRIIDLLLQNRNPLGVRQIDAKGGDESRRQVFADSRHGLLSGDEIAAGCRSDQLVILDLTFPLR
jgi:hypothetical protein